MPISGQLSLASIRPVLSTTLSLPFFSPLTSLGREFDTSSSLPPAKLISRLRSIVGQPLETAPMKIQSSTPPETLSPASVPVSTTSGINASRYAKDRKELIGLINSMRACGVAAELDLPRVAIIGKLKIFHQPRARSPFFIGASSASPIEHARSAQRSPTQQATRVLEKVLSSKRFLAYVFHLLDPRPRQLLNRRMPTDQSTS